MAITFSKQGDTAASVTKELLGCYDADFSERLWQENAGFKCRKLGVLNRFAPGYAIWVPEDRSPMGPRAAQLTMVHFDAMTLRSLEIVSSLHHIGIEVGQLLNMHEFMHMFQSAFGEFEAGVASAAKALGSLTDEESNISQAAVFGIAGAHTGIDTFNRVEDKFEKLVVHFKKALQKEHKLRRPLKNIKRVRVKGHKKHLVDKLEKSIKEASIEREQARAKLQTHARAKFSEKQAEFVFDKDSKYIGKIAGKKTWRFSNVFDAADIAEFCDALEHFGKVLIGAELVIDIYRLIENPEQRKHWLYYIAQDLIDILVGYAIGYYVGIALAALFAEALPALLIVILGILIGGVGAWVFEHYINPVLHNGTETYLDDLQSYADKTWHWVEGVF